MSAGGRAGGRRGLRGRGGAAPSGRGRVSHRRCRGRTRGLSAPGGGRAGEPPGRRAPASLRGTGQVLFRRGPGSASALAAPRLPGARAAPGRRRRAGRAGPGGGGRGGPAAPRPPPYCLAAAGERPALSPRRGHRLRAAGSGLPGEPGRGERRGVTWLRCVLPGSTPSSPRSIPSARSSLLRPGPALEPQPVRGGGNFV